MKYQAIKKIILETLNRQHMNRLIKESIGTDLRLLVDDIFFNNKKFEVNGYPVVLPNLIELFYVNIFTPELENGNISQLTEQERADLIINPKRRNTKTSTLPGVGEITIWNNGYSWIVYFKSTNSYFKVLGLETERFVKMVMDLIYEQAKVLKTKPPKSSLSHDEQKKKEQEFASKNNTPAAHVGISNERTQEAPKARKTQVPEPKEVVLPKTEPFKSKTSEEDLQKVKSHILRKRKQE